MSDLSDYYDEDELEELDSGLSDEERAAIKAEMEAEDRLYKEKLKRIQINRMRPEYEHDCKRCVYIGTVIDGAAKKTDCYVHESRVDGKRLLNYVLRDSSEPSDYASWTDFPDEVDAERSPTTSSGEKTYLWMPVILAQWMRGRYERGEYPDRKEGDES